MLLGILEARVDFTIGKADNWRLYERITGLVLFTGRKVPGFAVEECPWVEPNLLYFSRKGTTWNQKLHNIQNNFQPYPSEFQFRGCATCPAVPRPYSDKGRPFACSWAVGRGHGSLPGCTAMFWSLHVQFKPPFTNKWHFPEVGWYFEPAKALPFQDGSYQGSGDGGGTLFTSTMIYPSTVM